MDERGDPAVRYAVVVPPSCLAEVERVPERVRALLRIEVVTADPDSGEVISIAGE